MINLTSPQLEQYCSFKDCFIEYPTITEIYKIMDKLMFESTVGGEQQSMLLIGDTGVGKSALVDNYVARFKASGGRWEEQPILSTRVPNRVSEQDTLLRLLKDLDINRSPRKTKYISNDSDALAKSVIRSLKDKKVKLVIVNEIQELMEFKGADERQAIANTFKMISEEAQVPFVLIGMPYSVHLTDESQWNSRLGWRRQLDYFRLFKNATDCSSQLIADPEAKRHFAMFVAGLAARMGFSVKPNLTTDDILLPLFAVCCGELRALKHFLSDALLKALLQSRTSIDKALLAETFTDKYPRKKVNPFTIKLDELRIQELLVETSYDLSAQTKDERLIKQSFTDLLPVSALVSLTPLKA